MDTLEALTSEVKEHKDDFLVSAEDLEDEIISGVSNLRRNFDNQLVIDLNNAQRRIIDNTSKAIENASIARNALKLKLSAKHKDS